MQRDANGYTKYSKHQRIVDSKSIYDENGVLIKHEIIWNMPKMITSDVSFQLQFGFWPGDNWEPTRVMQSYGLGSEGLKANNTKYYNR